MKRERKTERGAAPAGMLPGDIAHQQTVWRRVSQLASQLADALQDAQAFGSLQQSLSSAASALVVAAMRNDGGAAPMEDDIVHVSD